MRKKIVLSLACYMFAILLACASFAGATILVVSPHPDDDLLAASGVTRQAVEKGERVIVVYVTNGDINGAQTGYQRQAEAVQGQAFLSNAEDNLIFLGYPDAYLATLYSNYPGKKDQFKTPLGQSVTYGSRGLGRSDYHFYKFGSRAAYNLYNMVMDLTRIITDYTPDHIIAPSQFDQHADHSTTAALVGLAVTAARGKLKSYSPTVHKYGIHWDNWPEPMDPARYFTEPPGLVNTPLLWSARESIDVPSAMQSLNPQENSKYVAISAHATQGGASGWLGRFVHKDEVFWIDTTLGGTNHAPVVNAGPDQTVKQGVQVTLDGSGSKDPEGNTVKFMWTQIAGATVNLSDPTAAKPVFSTPTGLVAGDRLVFQLVASDGQAQSLRDLVTVVVQPPACNNIAPKATVMASSETPGTGQTAVKAVDGVIDGYPGDYTREWATAGQRSGAWINLTWDGPYTVNRVILYDRPGLNDQIIAGTLTFSDGTTLAVGPLNNAGSATDYIFSAKTITSLTLTVNQVGGYTLNTGLAEIEVCGLAPVISGGTASNRAPQTNAGSDQTVSQGAIVTLDGSGSKDPDGNPITFAWKQISGTTVQLSNPAAVNPTFTAPAGSSLDEKLVFELVADDGQLRSAVDSVTVTVQPPAAECSNIAGLAKIIASSESPEAGQVAPKVADGVVDGWPGDYTREWASYGQGNGAWLNLTWSGVYAVNRVILYDRPNLDDQILAGTMSFSDGTSVAVGPLNNAGSAVEYRFSDKYITSLTLAVSQVSAATLNIGLAEIEVCGVQNTGVDYPPTANAGSDQSVKQGTLVTLDASGSRDPEGKALSYAWTQTGGAAVQLSNPTAMNPTFTAPSDLPQGDRLTFQLVVNDGQLQSAADSATVTVEATPTCSNITPLAMVMASSETPEYGQTAVKAIDLVVDGSPYDYTREWVTAGQGAGAWIFLMWNKPYKVSRVTLYDRLNTNDQILGGVINFSDGTSIQVGPLNNNGEATEYAFPEKSITNMALIVTQVSATTYNTGLAEIGVCGTP